MAESFPAIDTPESKNGSTIRSQRKSDFSAKTSVPRQKWSDEETSRLLRLRAENPHVAFEELEKRVQKPARNSFSSTQRPSTDSSVDTESESEGDIPHEARPEPINRLKRPSRALRLAEEPSESPVSSPEKRLRPAEKDSKIVTLRISANSSQAERSAGPSLSDTASFTHDPAPNDDAWDKRSEEENYPVVWKHFGPIMKQICEKAPKLEQADEVLSENRALKEENAALKENNIALNARLNKLVQTLIAEVSR